MRIIGEFDIAEIKITVFKMNEKISLKFEKDLLEQTYKFRDGSGLHNLDDARKFCNDSCMLSIRSIFKSMADNRLNQLINILENGQNEFDTII